MHHIIERSKVKVKEDFSKERVKRKRFDLVVGLVGHRLPRTKLRGYEFKTAGYLVGRPAVNISIVYCMIFS